MLQPGKRMIGPEMEEFLSRQNLSAQFAFNVQESDNVPYEKIFKNDQDSFAFIQENSNLLYEFVYSMDEI